MNKQRLHLKIVVAANSSITDATARLYKFRDEVCSFTAKCRTSPVGLRSRLRDLPIYLRAGMRRYILSCDIEAPWGDLQSAIYGLTIETNLGTISVRGRGSGVMHPNISTTLYHYRDPSGKVLRFEVYPFGAPTLKSLSKREISRPDHGRPVCLIGEYTNSARDNGAALFKELQAAGSQALDAYYVVERDNPDGFVPDGDRILEFGSEAHFEKCLIADVVAFTHHSTYVFPGIMSRVRSRQWKNVKRFFLQHGITALKKSMDAYRRKETGYDAINVCSRQEREIVSSACNFDVEDVPIAGFPRYDALLRNALQSKPDVDQILVFPTWRKGLEKLESDQAEASSFVTEWRRVLTELSRISNIKVAFILHPTIRRHAHLFEPYVHQIANASEFQTTLVASSALITDYSSVCFDSLYLGKPVFFFTFDEIEYGFAEGAYIDVHTHLPGEKHNNVGSLIVAVKRSRNENWPDPKPGSSDRFFAYRDMKNSERCAQVIEALARGREKTKEQPEATAAKILARA